MADYQLQSTWPEVDAAAQAFKNGGTVQTTKQTKKTSNMTAPVGVDENGKLWVAPGGGNPNGDTPAVGGGYVIPDGGIPATDLSQEVQDKLREQIAYNFATPAAYDDFRNRYGGDLKRGDIVMIDNADEDGNTIVYQLGKNATDPLALTPVRVIQPYTGEPGLQGQRGTGFLAITTAPTSHTAVVNGLTAAYRISLDTVKSQASVTEVFAGDTLCHGYYHYPVIYVDDSYAYCRTSVSVRGSAGADAVTWHTNVAPNSNRFVIADLNGPAGAVPAPGQMVISSYTGRGYFIAAVGTDAVTIANYTVQVKGDPGAQGPAGADGDTPVRGVDYWTGSDQESIVQQVITALGTPVFGTVDGNNNIILTGNLTDGGYVVKYEDENGVLTTIGTLSAGVTYTNVLAAATDNNGNVLNGTGYAEGYRFSGYGGNIANDTPNTDGYFVTGFIPYTNAQAEQRVAIYIKGITLDLTNLPQYLRVALVVPGSDDYMGQCTLTDISDSSQMTITQLGTGYYRFTPNGGFYRKELWNTKGTTHIRFTLPGSGSGVIITINEPIE